MQRKFLPCFTNAPFLAATNKSMCFLLYCSDLIWFVTQTVRPSASRALIQKTVLRDAAHFANRFGFIWSLLIMCVRVGGERIDRKAATCKAVSQTFFIYFCFSLFYKGCSVIFHPLKCAYALQICVVTCPNAHLLGRFAARPASRQWSLLSRRVEAWLRVLWSSRGSSAVPPIVGVWAVDNGNAIKIHHQPYADDWQDSLLEWVHHIADTSKKVDDACKIAYHLHLEKGDGTCWSRAGDYRQGWQDALAWQGGDKWTSK